MLFPDEILVMIFKSKISLSDVILNEQKQFGINYYSKKIVFWSRRSVHDVGLLTKIRKLKVRAYVTCDSSISWEIEREEKSVNEENLKFLSLNYLYFSYICQHLSKLVCQESKNFLNTDCHWSMGLT